MNQIKIHLNNLCVCFACKYELGDKDSFDSLDFRLNEGEILCLVKKGLSGSSTINNSQMGGIPLPKFGEQFWFAGESCPDKETPISSLIPSWSMSFLPWKNVVENMVFGFNGSEYKEKYLLAMEWLENVGLSGCALRLPAQISQTQRLRIALARVYMEKPKLIVADNPLYGLSHLDWKVMLEEFLRIWHQNPVPMVYMTSNIDEAIFLSDRIFLISEKTCIDNNPIDNPIARCDRNWIKIIETEEYEQIYDSLTSLNDNNL
ncbi:ATP-binding cassette domain-containing protein [Parasalinivibrio latis]|uniref:ATP-binding cassette domain-containing protein n=1 Tax=Parasalinivibrio latis TaxID=2952610 RepID=UPI0030E29CA2